MRNSSGLLAKEREQDDPSQDYLCFLEAFLFCDTALQHMCQQSSLRQSFYKFLN